MMSAARIASIMIGALMLPDVISGDRETIEHAQIFPQPGRANCEVTSPWGFLSSQIFRTFGQSHSHSANLTLPSLNKRTNAAQNQTTPFTAEAP